MVACYIHFGHDTHGSNGKALSYPKWESYPRGSIIFAVGTTKRHLKTNLQNGVVYVDCFAARIENSQVNDSSSGQIYEMHSIDAGIYINVEA